MMVPKQLYDTLLARWRARKQFNHGEQLEREHLEAKNTGRKFQASKDDLQDNQSTWQYDIKTMHEWY